MTRSLFIAVFLLLICLPGRAQVHNNSYAVGNTSAVGNREYRSASAPAVGHSSPIANSVLTAPPNVVSRNLNGTIAGQNILPYGGGGYPSGLLGNPANNVDNELPERRPFIQEDRIYLTEYRISRPWFPCFYDMPDLGYGSCYRTGCFRNSSGTCDDNQVVSGQDGYVIFNNQTFTGKLTITKNSVLIESNDPAHTKTSVSLTNQALSLIEATNNDGDRLDLIRFQWHSGLLRVVHLGKLTIYDGKYSFLTQPEDLDIKSLIVVYNGEHMRLNAFSTENAKMRLTKHVNDIYGMRLKAKDFTWRDLVLYIDKLD